MKWLTPPHGSGRALAELPPIIGLRHELSLGRLSMPRLRRLVLKCPKIMLEDISV